MKKMISVLIALAMVLSCAVLAEEDAVTGATSIPVDTEVQIDLGGEVGMADVQWVTMGTGEDVEGLVLTVRTENGEATWTSDYMFGIEVYATDLDSDGLTELFVTGDIASSDYYTFCLRYENGGLVPLRFPDVERGSDHKDDTDYGYGLITAFGENTLTLSGSQDILGTWFASRTFSLLDGAFEIADDGLWRFEMGEETPEIWEYRSLNPVQSIPVTFIGEDGDVDGTLLPGEKAMPTASDLESIVYFVTQDGREGYFTVAPNEAQYGWGSLINGISEDELFEYVPYAD